MKKRVLEWSAVLSLLAIVMLIAGYVAEYGVGGVYSHQSSVTTDLRGLELRIGDGRARVMVLNLPTTRSSTPPPVQIRWRPMRLLRRLPDARRMFWEFDAHPIPGFAAMLLACPIWCLILPCLIAPFLWLRKRRRREQMGFSVIENKRDTEAPRHREEGPSKAEPI